MRYLDGLAVDELFARTDSSGNLAWYLTDQLGSVTDVVSSSGTDLDHIVYDPYGNIVTETNASNGDRFKFVGMEYDSTAGLYYDHARYYGAAIGRFVSQDPKRFAAGDVDLYRYVGNNPTDRTDPSGFIEGSVVGGGYVEVYLGIIHIQVSIGGGGGVDLTNGTVSGSGLVTGNVGLCLGLGCSAGGFVTGTNTGNVENLGGTGGAAGLSTPVFGVGVTEGKGYVGGTVSTGPPAPVAGVHFDRTETWLWGLRKKRLW